MFRLCHAPGWGQVGLGFVKPFVMDVPVWGVTECDGRETEKNLGTTGNNSHRATMSTTRQLETRNPTGVLMQLIQESAPRFSILLGTGSNVARISGTVLADGSTRLKVETEEPTPATKATVAALKRAASFYGYSVRDDMDIFGRFAVVAVPEPYKDNFQSIVEDVVKTLSFKYPMQIFLPDRQRLYKYKLPEAAVSVAGGGRRCSRPRSLRRRGKSVRSKH